MKVLLTGGGSAGHVTPNLALLPALRERGADVVYVGSATGIEAELVAREGLPYRAIRAGKLRRYRSWRNLVDPFNVIVGVFQSIGICLRERPDVVFSKGGFVAVPVVFAAFLLRIPSVCHESDIVPGLANRLSFPFVRAVAINFEETRRWLPRWVDAHVTGTPLRPGLRDGDATAARIRLGIAAGRPVLLVFGGSLGASSLNKAVRDALGTLCADFAVLHVCGAGAVVEGLRDVAGYWQFEYVHDHFGDLLALADVVVGRAGANTIYELLALRRPHVLVPLPARASRGDQIVNADVMARAGFSRVIADERLSAASLVDAVREVYGEREAISARLAAFVIPDSVAVIVGMIEAAARKKR